MNAPANPTQLVTFEVGGTVRTNERHRHGKGRTWTPAKTKAARREIVQAFQEVLCDLRRAEVLDKHPPP